MSDYMNKIKENLPEMGHFTRRYLREILTVVALLAAAFSSWKGFLINGLGMSLLFVVVGLIVGIVLPTYVNQAIHKFYELTSKKGQTAEIIIECVKIVGAFFLAFIYFFGVGMLASSAYHYFSHHIREKNKH